MEAYEDNLEKMSEHKKTVRESTKATRDVYKNTDAKITSYLAVHRSSSAIASPSFSKSRSVFPFLSASVFNLATNVIVKV